MQNLWILEVDLSWLTLIIQEETTLVLVTHGKWDKIVNYMKKTLEGNIYNTSWELEDSNLTHSWLSGYLITSPLGRKGHSFRLNYILFHNKV